MENPTSFLREELAKLGFNFEPNFLISTSLHPQHAFRYACGEKLYADHQQLRKYVGYDEKSSPTNKYLGYVDIYFMPAYEFERTGGFFGLEEFGANSFSYTEFELSI